MFVEIIAFSNRSSLTHVEFIGKHNQQGAGAADTEETTKQKKVAKVGVEDQAFSDQEHLISQGELPFVEFTAVVTAFNTPGNCCPYGNLHSNYMPVDFTDVDFSTASPDSTPMPCFSSTGQTDNEIPWLDLSSEGSDYVGTQPAPRIATVESIPKPASIPTRGNYPSQQGGVPFLGYNTPPYAGQGGRLGVVRKGWLTPLHSAATRGHDRIVRLLLQHRPEADFCNVRDSDGATPLAHAITRGYRDVVISLLAGGACLRDMAVGVNGRCSALHWAVLKRREMCLKILLEH